MNKALTINILYCLQGSYCWRTCNHAPDAQRQELEEWAAEQMQERRPTQVESQPVAVADRLWQQRQ